MINVLDIGSLYGFPTSDVFPRKAVNVMVPRTPDDLIEQLDRADLVCFGGGADIHPSLYGCDNVASHCDDRPSKRDRMERSVFLSALAANKPMFGICRGAQFLCAMAGGKLIQDVTAHGHYHPLTTFDGKTIIMSSTHHQMMWPNEVPHTLIAWTPNLSREYFHSIKDYSQNKVDPEVVYFPTIHALAVQGHPEWMDPDSNGVRETRRWVREYLDLSF